MKQKAPAFVYAWRQLLKNVGSEWLAWSYIRFSSKRIKRLEDWKKGIRNGR